MGPGTPGVPGPDADVLHHVGVFRLGAVRLRLSLHP